MPTLVIESVVSKTSRRHEFVVSGQWRDKIRVHYLKWSAVTGTISVKGDRDIYA